MQNSTAPAASGRLRQLVYQLRTEGEGAGRDALAIGLGVFLGCLPLYGLHLALCVAAGWLFGLNRLKMYLAANISNPVMAPALVLAELQAGALVRRGELHALTLDTVRTADPWTFGADIVIGSLVIGVSLGALAGTLTWLAMRGGERDEAFAALVRRASDRYVSSGITAWEFARGKMRGDPLYRTVLTTGVLPSGGALVDVGCGQGLMLALLAEAAGASRAGTWRHAAAPPIFDEMIGIEVRPRIAALAQRALGDAATIVTGDARAHVPRGCRAVLFFDVLHMMPARDQLELLNAVGGVLDPDGVVLVREADKAAGWRFQAVRLGNRLKALAFGRWRQTFHFREASEWVRCFEGAGFDAHIRNTSEGTPFGNVLFVLTRRAPGSA